MGPLGAMFGLLAALTVAITFADQRRLPQRVDALGCAVMLMLMWSASNVLSLAYSPPESMGLYPLMDGMGGAIAAFIYYRRPQIWKLALAYCFLTQTILHVVFWGRGDMSYTSVWNYTLALNLLFLMQLACVAGTGIGDYVARACTDLLHRSGRVHSSGSSPRR
jgi:hypothetical protein